MAEASVPWITHMISMLPQQLQDAIYHRDDWCDLTAMKGAREVLTGVGYPNNATRRSLYASWLRVFASNKFQDSFDALMLDCVAATPSPTNPEGPLFADIFKAHDPVDHCRTILTPVLDLPSIPKLFVRQRAKVDPLPASPGFVDFLAELIRKSQQSRQALDEAGMIIGFCSLALATVVAKPVRHVQDLFRNRLKEALVASVGTSFDGEIPCPSEDFLTKLAIKGHGAGGVVKPYIVLLALGQYAYHTAKGEAAPSADILFLEGSFLATAKFGHLEVIKLLYDVEEKTGMGATELNRLIPRTSGEKSILVSSRRVDNYLRRAKDPKQQTRPWSRVANSCFFRDLGMTDNPDYAAMLTAFLALDQEDDHLWQEVFKDICEVDSKDRRMATAWAMKLKRELDN